MKSSRTNFEIQTRRLDNGKQANMLRALLWRSGVNLVENNLAILDHLAALEKSPGKNGALQEGPRGPRGPLARTSGRRNGGGRDTRRTEIKSKIKSNSKSKSKSKIKSKSKKGENGGGRDPSLNREKIESANCVAILAKMAMLRKNQGMLDGNVAKGMWQSWEMLELQITRRRGKPRSSTE
jgi:hypothetical protein